MKILQSKVNNDDDPFSNALTYGIISHILQAIEVPFYISQRAVGFRSYVVVLLCYKLRIDPLGDVTF